MSQRNYSMDCPDCGNQSMKNEGKKYDIITKKELLKFRCPQCRRWAYARKYTDTE